MSHEGTGAIGIEIGTVLLTEIKRELQSFFESLYSRLLVVGSTLSRLEAFSTFILIMHFVSFRGFRYHCQRSGGRP